MKKRKLVRGLVEFVLVMAFLFTVIICIGDRIRMSGYKEPVFKNAKVVTEANYNLNAETQMAMATAKEAAYQYASDELDKWIAEMMKETDRFANEYFEYGAENSRGLSAVYHDVMHKLISSHKTANEALMEDLEQQISCHLFNKEAAQARITNITNETVAVYMKTFSRELAKIQEKHSIPQPVWDRHIYHLCSITAGFDSRSVPITTKVVVSTVAGITLKVATPLVTKVGQHVGEKLAAKAGTKTVAKNFGKWIPGLGTLIATTVIGWDLIDYKLTAEKNKRALKAGFELYFQEMKTELLGPTEDSIIGSITLWENNIKSKLALSKEDTI